MKDVRIWFKKDGLSRFISHLDLSGCMSRAISRVRMPVWYTEGFNPHPFTTFALPLSLGIRGTRESMDVKALEDFNYESVSEEMSKCLPQGIDIIKISAPEMSAKDICYGRYSIYFESEGVNQEDLLNQIKDMLNKPEIIINKKTKSGMKEINIKDYIFDFSVYKFEEAIKLELRLPAGSRMNVNPSLVIDALEKYYGTTGYADITREHLYNEYMDEFK